MLILSSLKLIAWTRGTQSSSRMSKVKFDDGKQERREEYDTIITKSLAPSENKVAAKPRFEPGFEPGPLVQKAILQPHEPPLRPMVESS